MYDPYIACSLGKTMHNLNLPILSENKSVYEQGE